jgi:hypothetical protein
MGDESLLLKLGADTAAFQKGIDGAIKKLAGLTAAYLGVREMTEAFGAALEMGDQLSDLSKRTGAAAGDLAVLERAFKNTGNQIEDVGPMMNRMQKAIVEAGDPTSKQAELIAALGLSLGDLSKLSPDQQFEKMASAIGSIKDPSVAAAASMELFGKGGGSLLPLFKEMSENINQAKGELGDLPAIMDRSAGSFDNINDALGAIGEKQKEAAVGVLSELVPSLEAVTGSLSELNAAGFGVKIGEQMGRALQGFAAWFADPGDSLAAFGYILKAMLLEGGNYLLMGFKYAGDWLNIFLAALGKDWPAQLGQGLIYAGLGMARTIDEALMDVMAGLSGLPGTMGEAASKAFDFLDETDEKAAKLQGNYKAAGDALGNAINEANDKTKTIYDDVLGAGDALKDAADHAQKAMEKGSGAVKDASKEMKSGKTGSGAPIVDASKVSGALNGQGKRDEKLESLDQGLSLLEAQNNAARSPTFGNKREVENLKWKKNYTSALKDANEAGMDDPYGYANRMANASAVQPGRGHINALPKDVTPDKYDGDSPAMKMARDRASREAGLAKQKTGTANQMQPKETLDTMVSAIKTLLQKIEPRLPTPALAP